MKRIKIDSPTNARFRGYKSLLSARGIEKSGFILISGDKIILEALRDPQLQLECLILTKDMDSPSPKLECIELPKKLFSELDEFNTQAPLLVARCPQIREWKISEKASGTEVILALQDPANLGAALRICEAFEVNKIVLLQECANPFHPKAIRASSGSALRVAIYSGPSLESLKTSDLISLDLKGENLPDFIWPKKFRLFLGMEGPGVPAQLSSKRIRIPIKDGMDSLNAVSALSIALYASTI